MYKLNEPHYNRVNRSPHGKSTDFTQDIVEFSGNNCYIPTNGNCFIKYFKYLTGRGFTEEFSSVCRNEKRRSILITQTIFQPFSKKHNINIGCFDGSSINLRNITGKNIEIFTHKNHFCLIWKSNVISFNKAIEKLKTNF